MKRKEAVLEKTIRSKLVNGKRICPHCQVELERSSGWRPLAKKANYEYVIYRCPNNCGYATEF